MSQTKEPEHLTFEQILEAINEQRPCAPISLRRYLRKLEIKPIKTDLPTKPHRYAPDTPQRVLKALGVRIVTMPQLKAVKAKALAARGGRRAA